MIRCREWAKHQFQHFFIAWIFFTRLPAPQRFLVLEGGASPLSDGAPQKATHAARFLPLIGIIIGACAAGVLYLAALVWPVWLAVLLSMASTILITGALHEDGWADVCDGFGGGWTRDDILRIMQDSRLGAYGAIGLIVIFLAKFGALAQLAQAALPPEHSDPTHVSTAPAWLILIAGHTLSRLASVSLLRRQAYVRSADNSKSHDLAAKLSRNAFAFALLCGLAPVVVLSLAWALVPVSVGVLLAVIVCWWMTGYFKRRLGGYTGDCLGAVQQATEVAFYCGLLVNL